MTAAPPKLLAGVKVSVPFGFTTTVPCAGFATTALLTVSGSPSASVSFASITTVTGAFMGVEARSSPATGASFTGVTLSVSVAVRVTVPSVMV